MRETVFGEVPVPSNVWAEVTDAVDVVIDQEADGSLCAKLSAEAWELNIRASAREFFGLSSIREAHWEERRSLKVGIAAGVPVFWCSDRETATVLVGQDDETWDIAFTIPLVVVERLVESASRFPVS